MVFDAIFSAMGSACNLLPYCNYLMIGFKLVLLMFVIGWVREHMGGGMVAAVVTLVLGYLALFPFFYIFGSMLIVYLIMILGFVNIVQDLAFGKGHYGLGPKEGGQQLPWEMKNK
jgi:Na+-translocating ferredoxin:NAD+ oxidoreductase RnfE subunit